MPPVNTSKNQRHAFTWHLARLLVHAIYGAARAPGMIRRVLALLRELRGIQYTLGKRQDENLRRMQELRKDQEALYQQLQLLSESQHRQNELIRTQLDTLVVQPLTSRLLPIVDLLDQAIGRRADAVSGNSDDDGQALNKALRTQLFDVLGIYDIEPITVRPGDAFDADTMQPIETCDTADPNQHRRIAAVVRWGFRRNDRVVRPAAVRLYRYHAPELA